MNLCGFDPACYVTSALTPVWGWIQLGFWIGLAVLGLVLLLFVLDKVSRIFGRPGVWVTLASLALGAAFVLGRLSVPRAAPTAISKPRNLTKAEIARLQQALAARALYVGAIDGIFGAQSEKALIAFQKRRGDPPTGRPSQAQLEALGVWR